MTTLSTTPLGTSTTTHYSILNIPYPPPHRLLKPDVKLAYHRALLKHHPDKSHTASSNPAKTPTASIAFKTNGPSTGSNSNSQDDSDRETTSTSSITTETSNPAGTSKVSPPLPRASQLRYTIDQITMAYKVLSDPLARAQYDRSLRLLGINGNRHGNGHGNDEGTPFRTGMEVFDLDDMQMADSAFSPDSSTNSDENSNGGTWYHSCRCGEERGFVVLEEELEREAERGEVVVGCRGCSLWAKVMFAVDEGGEEEMENDRIS
ncbi:hypothetical protein ACJ73_09885 [Blastomyces percursus]|uniref:Diphthamide biosynthesis protein 4 n=1 Tax=Blastomyces percursus TaxID=1658174 RepID=A0A1J9P2Y7_9EURO|nr:hypothetical protein ACJ73_09885 [Blastomyces percursus]